MLAIDDDSRRMRTFRTCNGGSKKTLKTTYKEIREIEEINLLIEQGNATLKELGYTEHSKKHAAKVSDTAGKILTELGYGKHKIELARIAGYMTSEIVLTGMIMHTAVHCWHIRY